MSEKSSMGAGAGRARPLVSIVMPAFNRQQTLSRAISSVLAQTWQDWELLVTDDGSTDDSRVLAERAAAADPRIRSLGLPHRGVSAARNAGLAQARGQIFCYLDSDNSWRPDYLERVVQRLLGRRRSCCFAGLELHMLDAQGGETERAKLLNEYRREIILKRNQIDLNAFAHTADLYWIHGGFDEQMTRLVDWDFILRLTARRPPERIDEILGDYYHHRDPQRVSMSADYKWNRLLIALKHQLAEGFTLHWFGPEAPEAFVEELAGRGLPMHHHSKDEALAFSPGLRDVILWVWTPWDEVAGQLQRLAKKIDLTCGLSFYWVPDGVAPRQILEPGLHRKFHFVVLEDVEAKKRFARSLDERRTAQDINPIDTLLVRQGARQPNEDWACYLEQLDRYHFPEPNLSIGIGIQALSTENPLEWGDHQYATSLAAALERKGFRCQIIFRDQFLGEVPKHAIFLHLFGIDFPPLPPRGNQLRCAWIISHPDKVRMDRLAEYDQVFVASQTFAEHLQTRCPGMRVEVLHQATDARVFRPLPVETEWDLVFVGNSRKIDRVAVSYAARSRRSLAVWGAGWEELLPAKSLQPGFLAAADVAEVYNRAQVVLNDHWEDQARWGFVNNRIFDVLACDRLPLSDWHPGLEGLFPDLPTFRDEAEFNKNLEELCRGGPGSRAAGQPSPRRRILAEHTFDHRARTLLSRFGRLLRVRHPDGVAPYQRPRILYLHGNPNANTTRKRCLEISASLEELFEVRQLPFQEADLEAMLGSDLIVFQRWTHQHLDRLTHVFDCMGMLRELGRVFAYDIDDYVFHLGEDTPKIFLRSCDAVLVSTRHLAKLVAPYNSCVFHLPNGVDAERFAEVRQAYLPADKRRVLVASTDGLGLEQALRLADRLRGEFPDVELHFVSSLKEPPRHPGVVFHPMLDIDRLVALMRSVEVVLNLSTPSQHLLDNVFQGSRPADYDDFVDAKSELKFQYAGLLGKPLVTESRPCIYREVVRQAENGFLADGEDAQFEALGELLRDSALRARVGQRAKDDVLREHTLAARGPRYHQAFLELNRLRLARQGAWNYDPAYWLGAPRLPAGAARPRLEDLQQIQTLKFVLERVKRRTRGQRLDDGARERLLSSLRWRASSAVVDVIKHPAQAYKLPGRLVGLFREWRKGKVQS